MVFDERGRRMFPLRFDMHPWFFKSKGAQVMRFRRGLMLLACLLASVATLAAQETTGSVRGRIVDSQGLGVPGVSVTATGPQGSKTATSDTERRFNVPFLTPGAYTVRAQPHG